MRPSLRFLLFVVVGWGGLRAATLGALPAQLFEVSSSEAKAPPLAATHFDAIDPLPAQAEPLPPQRTDAPGWAMPASLTRIVRAYYPAPPAAIVPVLADPLPPPRRFFTSSLSEFGDYPMSRLAAASLPPLQSSVTVPGQSLPLVQLHKLDRLQLSSWAMLRSQRSGIAGSRSLSSAGSLGASQAGARLIYNLTPQLAAFLRTSSDVGRRGGEAAAGVRVQPLRSVPIWLSAERRQRIGRFGGGRNALALFLEGGLYDRPVPLDFLLNAYLQAGVVSMHRRDKFIDGGLTLTRPVYRNFSAGFGVWGGAQPGLSRVDVGPRVTMRVRNNVKVHIDWRQRVAGNALPGSGPAVTLAGDF